MGCLLAANAAAVSSASEPQVDATTHARMGDGPLHAYVANISLPADGLWRIRAPESANSIRELYLSPSQPSRLRQLGKRMYAALEERQIQSGRRQVQRGFEGCRQFAQEHGGIGPKSMADFADSKQWKYLADHWDQANYRTRELRDFVDDTSWDGPFIHLVPEVRFHFADPKRDDDTSARGGSLFDSRVRKRVPTSDRLVLAFELRPFVDDGKHWVLFTDGNCERVAIDPELIQTQQVAIRPIMDSEQAKVCGRASKSPVHVGIDLRSAGLRSTSAPCLEPGS